jgi:hypothetical protein
MTLNNASLSFVDVHIFGTGGFNYFSSSYGESKRSGEYEIVYAKAIVMFLSVLRHLKIPKPTSQQGRKTNKRK